MNKLELLAGKMRTLAYASPGEPIIRQLSGGVFLKLVFREGGWNLYVARKNVYPSGAEIKTFARDFGAPAEYIINPYKKRPGTEWRCYLMTWTL